MPAPGAPPEAPHAPDADAPTGHGPSDNSFNDDPGDHDFGGGDHDFGGFGGSNGFGGFGGGGGFAGGGGFGGGGGHGGGGGGHR